MKRRKKKAYKYETHLHTNVGSACGQNSPEEMVRAYKEAGYEGLFVTEHFWGGNTAIDRSLPWNQFVEKFCKGYERAKVEGDKLGIQVFFAWESGYRGTEFLIYGLSKNWLLEHPEIKTASIEEQYMLVKKGKGLVVHAHPFREEFYIPSIRLFPKYVDAVETVNATHSNCKSRAHFNPEYNQKAYAYAMKYDLPMTAGSDMHDSSNLFGGGMLFDDRLRDEADFINRIEKKEPYHLTDGDKTNYINGSAK